MIATLGAREADGRLVPGLRRWDLVALALYLIVLCFAEVGSRFRSTGGPYFIPGRHSDRLSVFKWVVAIGALVLIVWLLSNTQWTEIRLAGMALVLGFLLYLPAARRPIPAPIAR